MQTDRVHDTKSKILEVAYELFAKNGYEGTSIRDISKLADVNVAAVNYHFQNKGNLYQEIVKQCYIDTSEQIAEFCRQKKPNSEELALKIFDIYLEDSNFLVTTFRLFLSADFPFPENFGVEDDSFGPPGSHMYFQVLTREVGLAVSQDDKMWAMHVIFSQILHSALVLASPNVLKKKHLPHVTDRGLAAQGLRRMVKITVEHLKKKKNT
jgi:AcrR family transcriptional regulator